MVRIQKYMVKFAQNYIFCRTQRVDTLNLFQRTMPWQINLSTLKARLTKKDQKKKKRLKYAYSEFNWGCLSKQSVHNRLFNFIETKLITKKVGTQVGSLYMNFGQ